MKKLLITISLLFILFQSKSFSCGIRQGISFREPSKNNQIVIGKINISGPLLAFDLNGKIIPGFDKIPIKQKINYDYIEQNGILLVSHDEVYNFYDIKNNFNKIGDEYVSVTLFSEGFAIVSAKNERLKIIDEKGKTIAILNDFKGKSIESASEFSNGLAAVRTEDDLWGFIDTKGNMVIEPQFTNTSYFNESYCVVEVRKKRKTAVGIINKKGEFTYPLTLNIKFNEKVSNGLIGFKRTNDSFGVMNVFGKELMSPSNAINWLGPFYNNALAVFSNGKNFGVINKESKVIARCNFNFIQILDKNIIGINNNNIDVFDLNGNKKTNLNYRMIVGLNNGNFLATDNDGMVFLDKDFNEINKTSIIGIEASPNFYTSKKYARTDYFDTKKILSNPFLQISLTSIAGLKVGDGPVKMINYFDLEQTKQFDLIEDEESDEILVIDQPEFENVEANMYGFIKKLITIEPLTPEEEAKRAADSIASLDEEKYYDEIDEDDEGRMYYDSLRFLSDKKSQTVNVYDIPNFQLTYYLNYNDFLKNNTFEEKKNSCNTCNLIGTSINNNAKLIGYDLLIEMNGKASGKAEELLENLKLVFKNLGLSVEKKGYEYILINTKQNNKKVGSIKSTNDDLVTINFIF
jgi:hypothetical protein